MQKQGKIYVYSNANGVNFIMLKRYEKFLKDLDKRLNSYYELHKGYLYCKKGCTECCEIGEYPFSRLEAEYIMSGFIKLNPEKQVIIKENIKNLLEEKNKNKDDRFTYRCPFLINKECALYKYRGLVCRTFGLAYVSDGKVVLPECVNSGLNYSSIYSKTSGEIILDNPVMEDLHIDKLLKNKIAENFELECGEIRPLIEWFS